MIAVADGERCGSKTGPGEPFHQLVVSVNHARHPFTFIPRRAEGEREEKGSKESVAKRTRTTGQRSSSGQEKRLSGS